MAAKAMNVKLEETKILDLKQVTAAFHITMTDAINEALDAYLEKMKSDPFYRLTANVEQADEEESNEILGELNAMSDDDLSIATTKRFTV